MKKLFTLVLALCVSVTMISGCYGPFKLTKKVYEWNGSLENPWGREALFLVMNIIPVYGFSLVADAVFLNLVEFWGGEPPISRGPKKSRMVARGDQQAVVTLSAAEKRLRLDLFRGYRPDAAVIIEAEDGRTVARNARGEVLMSARTVADGSVLIEDAHGRQVAMQPAAARQ